MIGPGTVVTITDGAWSGSSGVVQADGKTLRTGPLITVLLDTGERINVQEAWVSE